MSGIEQAVEALAQGRMIIITGDRLRGGDIDFAIAARYVTADAVNFMASYGRGLICLAMRPERAVKLGISLINPGAERQSGRPFGRSIEARAGVSTGISAADRTQTIRVAMASESTGDDLVSPGHVFPLIAAPGGVRERAAAVEASIELCKLAGAGDMAVICSIMRDDGEMARIEDLDALVTRHAIPVADIGALLDRLGS
ncbi:MULTISPECIES: 3,4-dihydroxy-2-butanone-4-phosphate synthase [unclassified Sphingopyxis]|jgi:3,4-dihydroxy 2-butanone 4-phosphate synthase/GTP cyclohydrolase II|uniref:3,4-dihydroxy-2-butanone-4-phosphate synthase n=1 Tax=unclassified Sphingopyxis TaxID=2614943 RepID=UPI0002D1B2F8|nr:MULTISPECIES: 3,4-dihydroxy-2-butanone-4-phosphate synthase [unclassified Sphingopyxis]ENY81073.1 3,4-dihydroxy-2-butanone 4-phosphate synthase [Sphingopyxis sp. MC1]MBU7590669.1 3,4-dihydroxy-2-butanone-4-phosphate synthase [Sphingopyxis terrae]